MMIRAYEPEDAAALADMHNTLYPNRPRTPFDWQQHMADIARIGGHTWVLTVNGAVIGCAAALPVPGLAGLVEMEGFVAPAWQRQGWGGRLLQYIRQEAAEAGISQLSYATPGLDTPAARFFRKNHFFVEHEEWTMTIGIGEWAMGSERWSTAACHLRSYPRNRAIALFCRLYSASFAGAPWDQPFTEAEVARLLADGRDLKFLVEGTTPIGFVWVRRLEKTAVMLEPIGIIQAKQGQGYGRYLLQTILKQLTDEGVTAVTLGVWANNKTAIRLYQSCGFRQRDVTFYLAYDVKK